MAPKIEKQAKGLEAYLSIPCSLMKLLVPLEDSYWHKKLTNTEYLACGQQMTAPPAC